MATDAAIAILLGGVLGAGILCLLAAAPRWRAASLTTRIAPYVRDAVEDAALPAGVLPVAGILPVGGARTIWQRLRTRSRSGSPRRAPMMSRPRSADASSGGRSEDSRSEACS
jgi:hypothetical protein